MGIGRNDMEKEQSALFATAVSLGDRKSVV